MQYLLLIDHNMWFLSALNFVMYSFKGKAKLDEFSKYLEIDFYICPTFFFLKILFIYS